MKALFHDEEDGNSEPIPGLPEELPQGEEIMWQGKPNGLTLTIQALRIRLVFAYFALFTLWRIAAIAARDGATSEMAGVATSSMLGVIAAGGLLFILGWLMARSTIYTITNRRIVFRYGVAIRKYVNIPFTAIKTAGLKHHGRDRGSIALSTTNKSKIAYLHLWPHARPWRFSAPQPMLRAIANADQVAATLCSAMKNNAPSNVNITLEAPTTDVAAPIHGKATAPA